ncbi:TetR/AcrR family transcriptional regulator [Ruegeria pomeroyi]|uniref:TetR/AcrR family transcriptional regulator n=1 Tax=Ruegeria alba TaxID=2916756 RepID=A0ABS9P334_9RHOB|nr:TetR/AcrR family transcriptional regulator [Ruegeria alba]MCE8514652.1 TetR/AcrR family transcriptional regulator [Ruegeria pomeroyi]MCE8523231.1 TetR/AcrR family transcriptional regulator [Ruegeria pomeroyi]MCE8531375.1 TetR/AcrR family transcriptional regulator [Ruegeria pomeroyi]MCG6560200.1 TetR/AcrR family transcriptional regulator [Ruegeria alba]
MARPPQKRRLETRARLLAEAARLVDAQGYAGLRVEDVVEAAGVAKGTLFSHFSDKDGLLAVLIGAEVMRLIDEMENAAPPADLPQLIERLVPLLDFVASDRVIFDLLLRYSGSTGAERDEIVTQGFYRQIDLWAGWIVSMQAAGTVRGDHPPALLAEGIQAFLNQVIAIRFCQGGQPTGTPAEALYPFLAAWLIT